MMMSATSDDTIAPNAAPMITPIARSTTLPRSANFLKSSSMAGPPRLGANVKPRPARSVHQPGMHHGIVYGGLGLVLQRDQRQTHGVRASAEQRQRILGGRGIGLDKQRDVERHQLVLHAERGRIVAAQARALEFRAE